MQTFTFNRASSADQAIALAADARVRFIAGGTTLTDLMKLGVEHPARVVDINRLLRRVTQITLVLPAGAVQQTHGRVVPGSGPTGTTRAAGHYRCWIDPT